VTAFLSSICAASAGVFMAKWLQRWPAFRQEPLAVTAPSDALPGDDHTPLEIERPDVIPLTPGKRIALWSFFALFVGLFFLLLFPENVERGLQALNAAWHAPLPPTDFAGKPLWMRGLMSASLLA